MSKRKRTGRAKNTEPKRYVPSRREILDCMGQRAYERRGGYVRQTRHVL